MVEAPAFSLSNAAPRANVFRSDLEDAQISPLLRQDAQDAQISPLFRQDDQDAQAIYLIILPIKLLVPRQPKTDEHDHADA
jgi:hypothetical protein